LEDQIKVRGAREHNLKNVDLNIPKNKLVIFTGVSGSGKSSMAMDTIYAEGQRRYVESLSSYARQFLGVMNKPEIESIEGLSPAIAIDQKTTSKNPRSTVGTVTEIYDYLRVIFARIGRVYDPKTGKEIKIITKIEIKNFSLLGFPIFLPSREILARFAKLFEKMPKFFYWVYFNKKSPRIKIMSDFLQRLISVVISVYQLLPSPLIKTLNAAIHLFRLKMNNIKTINIPNPIFQGKAQKVITTGAKGIFDIP